MLRFKLLRCRRTEARNATLATDHHVIFYTWSIVSFRGAAEPNLPSVASPLSRTKGPPRSTVGTGPGSAREPSWLGSASRCGRASVGNSSASARASSRRRCPIALVASEGLRIAIASAAPLPAPARPPASAGLLRPAPRALAAPRRYTDPLEDADGPTGPQELGRRDRGARLAQEALDPGTDLGRRPAASACRRDWARNAGFRSSCSYPRTPDPRASPSIPPRPSIWSRADSRRSAPGIARSPRGPRAARPARARREMPRPAVPPDPAQRSGNRISRAGNGR